MNTEITLENFFQCSRGIFESCPTPDRKPDYISYSGKKESSRYWFQTDVEDYHTVIIRSSNHWGECVNCNWLLDGQRPRGKDWLTGCISINELQFNHKAVEGLIKKLHMLPAEWQMYIKEAQPDSCIFR
jgi:hypothetical protein